MSVRKTAQLGFQQSYMIIHKMHRVSRVLTTSMTTSLTKNPHVDGIMVAPMIDDGVETIMGVVRDPVFGPTVMFGLGGVFVEVLKDVTFRVAPFGVDIAHEMIGEVKGRAMLDGVRGAPPSDVDALAEALAKLSAFAAANADTLETADVNPFLVRPKGKGAVAVDALVIGRTD